MAVAVQLPGAASFAGGYDRTGGLGYRESGQENLRNDDQEVDAFAKRA